MNKSRFIVLGVLSLIFMGIGYGTASAWSTEGTRWGSSSYQYSFGTDFSSDGKNSVNLGASAWNTINNYKPKVTLQPTGTTNTTTSASKNGNNEIFKVTNGTNSYLANTSYWYDSSSKKTSEADVALNVSFLWSNDSSYCPSGSYDVASVFVHEFGHVLGLGHSGFGDAIMYYTLASGTIKRTLTQDDIDGYNGLPWNA